MALEEDLKTNKSNYEHENLNPNDNGRLRSQKENEKFGFDYRMETNGISYDLGWFLLGKKNY